MPSELRVVLAKAQIGEQLVELPTLKSSHERTWPFSSWTEAVTAFAREEADADIDPRFPVIVRTGGEDDRTSLSLEMLQELANIPRVPSLRTANTTDRSGSFTGEEVNVVDLDWDSTKLLRARTQYESVFIWISSFADGDAEPTAALAVKSIDPDWKRRPWVPWAPKSWAMAMRAYSKANITLDPVCPVLIDESAAPGPIGNPEALQKLLDLPRPPPTLTTRLTRFAGDWTGDEVIVAEIDIFKLMALQRLAIMEEIRVWFPDAEQQKVRPMNASVVKAIRETPIKEGEKWQHWGEAVEAFSRGEFAPEVRHPVMISKPGDVNLLTARKLQSLTDLDALPQLRKTTLTESFYGLDGVEVEIADISSEQLHKLEDRTENDCSEYVWFPNNETGEPQMRTVMRVTKIHEKWRESLEWEESMERGESSAESSSDSNV